VKSEKWKVEARSWKVEAGKWKMENGKWKVNMSTSLMGVNFPDVC